MNAIVFLIDVVGGLYLSIILLRLWLQMARADFYNPMSQAVVKATQPVVGPLRRIIPSIGPLDTATLLFAYIVSCLIVTIKVFLVYNVIPVADVLIAAGLQLINKIYWLIFIVLIVRAILSWVSQGRNPIELLLYQLTEPMLRPIRKVIPPMGGLDLSMLVLIIGLQFVKILITDLIGPII
ncbi:YggT family protein [Glaciecola sp. 1036]|uniref:YggT family protein n=1 Tax=Alteromonadaceae TaxID=72275 RepID=UPI003D01567D